MTTVVGPTADTFCPSATTRSLSYQVNSGRSGVNVTRVELSVVGATAGITCVASPNSNGEWVYACRRLGQHVVSKSLDHSGSGLPEMHMRVVPQWY